MKTQQFLAVLQDPRSDRVVRTEALKYVIHLIGDAHQPLHDGDDGDEGGNTRQVIFDGKPENLHWVWDTGLLDDINRNPDALAAELNLVSCFPSVWTSHRLKPAKWGSFKVKRIRRESGDQRNHHALPASPVTFRGALVPLWGCANLDRRRFPRAGKAGARTAGRNGAGNVARRVLAAESFSLPFVTTLGRRRGPTLACPLSGQP